MSDDFFTHYLKYTEGTEAPVFFNRWSAISGLGGWLGRNFYFKHGHFQVNPNLYTMLIGSPGTRKSTAIKIMKQLLTGAGYTTIAASKTTKEKFILDLAEGIAVEDGSDSVLNKNLWGEDTDAAECFIMADEFNDFFGNGNLEFISLLGTLWDYSGRYENRIKNGKSVSINNPTISILGGNTPVGFSLAFPTEILGQGFFSRLLLVYGEPSGKKITFPIPPTQEETVFLVEWLMRVKQECVGEATLTSSAHSLLDKIYKTWQGVDDVRFESYANRRFTHLLKMCVIFAASRISRTIDEVDVIRANTILTYTEYLMPKALGEFGKAKNSDVAQKVLDIINRADSPVTLKEIWQEGISNDLDGLKDLGNILVNLQAADKIQTVGQGFLPKKKAQVELDDGTLDYSILTTEEKDVKR